MRKSIISTVASASLASVVLLCAANPAAAAAKTCNTKYDRCLSHCSATYPSNKPRADGGSDFVACVQRTCDKQLKNCTADSTGKGGTKAQVPTDSANPKGGPLGGGVIKDEPKAPPKSAGQRLPMGGGVLNQSSTSGSGAGGTILKSAGGRR